MIQPLLRSNCPAQQKIEIHIEDLYSNFVGLPEYPAGSPGFLYCWE